MKAGFDWKAGIICLIVMTAFSYAYSVIVKGGEDKEQIVTHAIKNDSSWYITKKFELRNEEIYFVVKIMRGGNEYRKYVSSENPIYSREYRYSDLYNYSFTDEYSFAEYVKEFNDSTITAQVNRAQAEIDRARQVRARVKALQNKYE